MNDKEYQLELEKAREREKSKRELYATIFWLGFWVLVIGGCTITGVL